MALQLPVILLLNAGSLLLLAVFIWWKCRRRDDALVVQIRETEWSLRIEQARGTGQEAELRIQSRYGAAPRCFSQDDVAVSCLHTALAPLERLERDRAHPTNLSP